MEKSTECIVIIYVDNSQSEMIYCLRHKLADGFLVLDHDDCVAFHNLSHIKSYTVEYIEPEFPALEEPGKSYR